MATTDYSDKFSDKAWYHGRLTREEAKNKLELCRDSCFLIRESERQKTLVLSLKQNEISNYKILREPQGYKILFPNKTFSASFQTLDDMISHYKNPDSQMELGKICKKTVDLPPIDSSGHATAPPPNNRGPPVGSGDDPYMIPQLFEHESNVTWKKCANLPSGISVPQAVQIGEHVYVGGGIQNRSSNIFKYSIIENTWTTLSGCPTVMHSLASLDDKLQVIGGQLDDNTENIVYTLTENTLTGDSYEQVLPPMHTRRHSHSSVTYQNRIIIAAGGITEDGNETRSVEIYIKEDDQWYPTQQLPFTLKAFSLTIIKDTCYILGGLRDPDERYSRITMHTTISSLLENKERPETVVTSRTLKEKHRLVYTAITEMDEILCALGGSVELNVHQGIWFIRTYITTKTWMECTGARVPETPIYRSTVLNLKPYGHIYDTIDTTETTNAICICIGGHNAGEHSNEVHIGQYH